MKCGMLEDHLEEAMRLLGTRWPIERIIDPEEMARFGAPGVPALYIDGEMVLAGRVPDAEDLVGLLR
jgi:Thioredoxin domain